MSRSEYEGPTVMVLADDEPTWDDVYAAIGREVWRLAPQDFQDAGHRDLVFGTCWQNIMEAVYRGLEKVASPG